MKVNENKQYRNKNKNVQIYVKTPKRKKTMGRGEENPENPLNQIQVQNGCFRAAITK